MKSKNIIIRLLIFTVIISAVLLGFSNNSEKAKLVVQADEIATPTVTGVPSPTLSPTPVLDTVKPVISGVKNITTTKGKKVNLLKGVKAKDNVDGNITKRVKVTGVNFNKVGTQKITYSVTDKAGNKDKETAKITIKSNEVSCSKYRYVKVSTLTVRKDANSNAGKVKVLSKRTKVHVIATVKNSVYVKVRLSSGKVGYVNSKYLSISRPASPSHVTHKSTTHSSSSHKSTTHKKSSSSSTHKKSSKNKMSKAYEDYLDKNIEEGDSRPDVPDEK